MIENLPMIMKLTEAEIERAAQLREQLGLNNRLAIVYTGTFERYQGVNLLVKARLSLGINIQRSNSC
jgi:hypothetical protein